MRKISIIVLVGIIVFTTCLLAKDSNFTTPIKLWLANNEAQAMSSISIDNKMIQQVTTPFAFMPYSNEKINGAEQKLWQIHYKVYHLLDEVSKIYTTAKKYGTGKFAILLKRSRPAIWALFPFQQVDYGTSLLLALQYRKAFHSTLLATLQLDPKRDYSLANRLTKETKKLSDSEYRMFNNYIQIYSALYPMSPSPKIVSSFIKLAKTRQFAKGIHTVLIPISGNDTVSGKTKTSKNNDPLAELDEIANMDSEGNVSSDASHTNQLDVPEKNETEDMYNIFD